MCENPQGPATLGIHGRASLSPRHASGCECCANFQATIEVVNEWTKRYDSIGLRDAEQLKQALANVGVDLDCGACASVFYTGVGLPHDEHTCKLKDRPPLEITVG